MSKNQAKVTQLRLGPYVSAFAKVLFESWPSPPPTTTCVEIKVRVILISFFQEMGIFRVQGGNSYSLQIPSPGGSYTSSLQGREG